MAPGFVKLKSARGTQAAPALETPAQGCAATGFTILNANADFDGCQ
jgi:hypothetical protein